MEVLTSEEETRILTETSNIDVDKLEHYIDLFEKWFDGQKHLPKTYGKYKTSLLLKSCVSLTNQVEAVLKSS